MKRIFFDIIDALAFIFCLSILFRILQYFKIDPGYIYVFMAILFLIIWIVGKLILRRLIVSRKKENDKS